MADEDQNPEAGRPLSKSQVFRDNRPYGDPIRDAIASGDLNQMRRVAAHSTAWLREVEKEAKVVRNALSQLNEAMKYLEK